MLNNSESMIASKSVLAALLALSVVGAQAQSHVERKGPYLLRSSSVSTMDIPPGPAREHGIERAEDRALLNVAVQWVGEGNALRNVSADVTAQIRTAAGMVQDVAMKETWTNGYVAYSGVYSYLPREVIDIMVTATPRGAQEPISVTYSERMWARRR